jgi:hypothetical protein
MRLLTIELPASGRKKGADGRKAPATENGEIGRNKTFWPSSRSRRTVGRWRRCCGLVL